MHDENGPGHGKVVGIVCTRGRRSKPCVHCGRGSDRLCDFALTGPKAGTTCDRPLCVRCSWRPAGTDADYCRAHAPLVAGLGRRP